MGTWIAATVTVLLLVILLGRGAGWLLRRATVQDGAAEEMGLWRVGPDARVRALRVFDEVHVLYERGRESTLLTSCTPEVFERRRSEFPSNAAVSKMAAAPRWLGLLGR